MSIKAAELFYAYSHKDEALREELEKHLSTLRRSGAISGWHDRRIDAGAEWSTVIDEHVNSARIILLLISSDFIASDYCHEVEMRRALEGHPAGEALLIPVILRPVDWKESDFAHLQALPKDGKPVTLWSNVDDALRDVAEGIRSAIGKASKSSMRHVRQSAAARITKSYWILEGAAPAVMPQSVARDVVAIVSTRESPGLAEALARDSTYSAGPNDVKGQPFELEHPRKLRSLPVLVRLWAPDFQPQIQKAEFSLSRDTPSQPIVFFVEAAKKRTDLLLKLELLVENKLVTTRLLKTNVSHPPRREPEEMSLGEPEPKLPPRPPRGWSVVISIPLTVKRVEAYSPFLPGVRK